MLVGKATLERCKIAYMVIGDKIKQERIALDLSQDRLAQDIGVARVTITDWENNKVKPKSEHLLALAITLRVNMYWLLSDDYDKDISQKQQPLSSVALITAITKVEEAMIYEPLPLKEKARLISSHYLRGKHYSLESEIATIKRKSKS